MLIHLNGDYDECIVTFATNNFPRKIYNQAKVLKEEGNICFKEGDFIGAGAKYDRRLKFLCFGLPRNGDDNVILWNLAIAIELNLAAYALKVCDFVQTKELCSLVIMLDSSNVKSLYRRALVKIRLYQLEEAVEDLGKAVRVEPNNQDILRELEKSGVTSSHVTDVASDMAVESTIPTYNAYASLETKDEGSSNTLDNQQSRHAKDKG
ncbi:70 kDa peptidyl-prolyl isomerase-like [Chenopodium quinoa]|uniref:70 kDa peptidyl-prolyl isomerase-like n=1 Tax=Chenopodium quinoa TaxID=63459 RepID=UPI000B78513F|nr:70 kDa peptidyl-prolyl isomerase-like [Chenopodium quinoa]